MGQDVLQQFGSGSGADFDLHIRMGALKLPQHLWHCLLYTSDAAAVACGDEDQFLPKDGPANKVRVIDRPGNERRVQTMGQDVLQQFGSRSCADFDLHIRMGAMKLPQYLWQPHRRRGLHRTDAQIPPDDAVVTHDCSGLGHERLQSLRVTQQAGSGRRERHTATVTREQRDLEIGLQLLHARGDVGLDGVQFRCGRRDGAMSRDGEEGGESGRVHVAAI